MTIGQFLGRLERVRKTTEGWMAACPAHEDRVPSLGVAVGEEGRILLRCHADCELDAVVAALGLRVSDLFAEAPASREVMRPALEVPPVAEWLRDVRRLPDAEISRMWATETLGAPAVVFPYRDAGGAIVYQKLRSLSVKKFWRRPSGRESILYGLAELADAGSERVVVVEGELDVHALRAVGIGPAVSVPDGSGSRLTPELLAPLGVFREVIIATDADTVGDALAARLARALMPERCRRARFVAGPDLKDANDALQTGWGRAEFEGIIAEAPVMEAAGAAAVGKSEAGTSGDPGREADDLVQPAARRYEVIDGCICYRRTDRKGNDVVECLANFDARVDEEVTFDDGAEVRREFRISGRLASGESLGVARVSASEFGGLGWITREWGIRAVVAAGNGTKDHLRTAIQHLSSPARRRIHRHTGWIDRDGHRAFLFQGGAIGAEGIEVDLPPPLDRFRLPSRPEGVREAVSWSLRLLDCGPLEVTAPLLSAVYVAPISTVVNPDVSVWLHGRSGSLKSTLSALCQAHFGDFDRKTLSGSWSSTDNSLEHRLFILADTLSVIDDYAPQPDPRSQKELDRRVQRIIRNVGNRASRGRLGADLNHRPDRPPRGFLLCNGEDTPPGLSILARLFPVEVERRRLKLKAISALQRNSHRLKHAMAGFIAWLKPRLEASPADFLAARESIREGLQKPGLHLRQPEAIATLLLGLDLGLSFALEVGAVDRPFVEETRFAAREALQGIADEQSALFRHLDPVDHFLRVLGTLITQGRICLLDHRCDGPRPDIEMVGWRKEEMALVIPDAAHRRVALFVRETGGYWNPSRSALQKDLLARGVLRPAGDGRATHVWRVGVGGRPQRGWAIELNALMRAAEDDDPGSSLPLSELSEADGGNADPHLQPAEFPGENGTPAGAVTALPLLGGWGAGGAGPGGGGEA
jgi:hypothetical protein